MKELVVGLVAFIAGSFTGALLLSGLKTEIVKLRTELAAKIAPEKK